MPTDIVNMFLKERLPSLGAVMGKGGFGCVRRVGPKQGFSRDMAVKIVVRCRGNGHELAWRDREGRQADWALAD